MIIYPSAICLIFNSRGRILFFFIYLFFLFLAKSAFIYAAYKKRLNKIDSLCDYEGGGQGGGGGGVKSVLDGGGLISKWLTVGAAEPTGSVMRSIIGWERHQNNMVHLRELK